MTSEAAMHIITNSHRNVADVIGSVALICFVWLGCAPAGDTEVSEGAEGSEGVGVAEDELALPIEPKHDCVALFADSSVQVGTVCVTIDPVADTSETCIGAATGTMNVTYTTTDGWELTEAHLAAGDSMLDIPINDQGNPVLGQFSFNSGDITGATSHVFVVPLCALGLDGAAETCDPITAYLAAHAALRKHDGDGTWQLATAWGNGERSVESGDWAAVFTMMLECGNPEPAQLETCETAFAKGDAGTCFIGADFDRDGSVDGIDYWGWSNGPIAPGTGAAWPVYAAAGECDVAEGTRIGSLSVSYGHEGSVQIVFDRVGDFVLDEEHLHVGNEPLPPGKYERYTVAPGRYPIVRELDDATHTETRVSGLSGDIHIVYHAVACWNHGH